MTLPRLHKFAALAVAAGVACGGDGGGGPQPTRAIAKTATSNGDGQTDTVRATLDNPLRVLVTQDGAPAPGVNVTWTAPAGAGSVSSATTATGADGIAQVTRILGPTAGPQTAQAAVAGAQGSPVTFAATAEPGNAAAVEIASGTNNQVGAPGVMLSPAYGVRALDAHGNAKPGVLVSWAVETGSGSVAPAQSTTGSNGIATSTRTLGAGEGTFKDTATATGLTGSPLVFTVTAFVAPSSADVSVGPGNTFGPDSVLIAKGGSVTWTWSAGAINHNVTFTTAGAPGGCGTVSTGSCGPREFPNPGTYDYHCTLHQGMNGKVVVAQ